jgi:hypothetical protein
VGDGHGAAEPFPSIQEPVDVLVVPLGLGDVALPVVGHPAGFPARQFLPFQRPPVDLLDRGLLLVQRLEISVLRAASPLSMYSSCRSRPPAGNTTL